MPHSTGRAVVQISTLSSRFLPIVILLGKKQHLYLRRQLSCVCSLGPVGKRRLSGCVSSPAFLSRSCFLVGFAWHLCGSCFHLECPVLCIRLHQTQSCRLSAAHIASMICTSVETPAHFFCCFCCSLLLLLSRGFCWFDVCSFESQVSCLVAWLIGDWWSKMLVLMWDWQTQRCHSCLWFGLSV